MKLKKTAVSIQGRCSGRAAILDRDVVRILTYTFVFRRDNSQSVWEIWCSQPVQWFSRHIFRTTATKDAISSRRYSPQIVLWAHLYTLAAWWMSSSDSWSLWLCWSRSFCPVSPLLHVGLLKVAVLSYKSELSDYHSAAVLSQQQLAGPSALVTSVTTAGSVSGVSIDKWKSGEGFFFTDKSVRNCRPFNQLLNINCSKDKPLVEVPAEFPKSRYGGRSNWFSAIAISCWFL